MVFICISGILGLLQSKWSQEDIRNAIFTTLNGRHFAFLDDHWQMRRIRRLFVKCAAVLYFSIGLIVAALSPLVFIFAIAVLELLLQEYPQSEYSDAVGAWGMYHPNEHHHCWKAFSIITLRSQNGPRRLTREFAGTTVGATLVLLATILAAYQSVCSSPIELRVSFICCPGFSSGPNTFHNEKDWKSGDISFRRFTGHSLIWS